MEVKERPNPYYMVLISCSLSSLIFTLQLRQSCLTIFLLSVTVCLYVSDEKNLCQILNVYLFRRFVCNGGLYQ